VWIQGGYGLPVKDVQRGILFDGWSGSWFWLLGWLLSWSGSWLSGWGCGWLLSWSGSWLSGWGTATTGHEQWEQQSGGQKGGAALP